MPHPLTIRAVGGPTTVIEIGGLRLLTDPTFDPPGDYPIGDRTLTKTAPAALSPGEVGAVDAVLLSHDQHWDNLDRLGREFLARVPRVLTTASAATRIAHTTALPNWDEVVLRGPGATRLHVTGTPAQHGPDGTEALVGEVTGFVLWGDRLPTVYVSGDNASLDVVARVAERFPVIDVALIFAGAARTPLVDGYLTLTSVQAARAAALLGARRVVPVHCDSWRHFTEGAGDLRQAFARAGLADRLVLLDPGQVAVLPGEPPGG